MDVHQRANAPAPLVLGFAMAVAGLLPACSVSAPPAPTPNQLGATTALIVSADELVGELGRLADHKRRSGLPTQLVPLSEALAAGQGPDDPARLRDYLQGVWHEGELAHVLLVGDADTVPVRQIALEVEVDTVFYDEAIVAAELYYADLDGDWDSDGDQIYGEIDDLADFLPDVSIGRLPLDSPSEAAAYIDKLLDYEAHPRGDYEHHVLLTAGYADMGVYGSAGLEGYVVPELPAELELTRVYADYDVREDAVDFTAHNFNEAYADGQNVAFMMGHGSEHTMAALDSCEEVDAIPNAGRPGIYITTECLGGRFDYDGPDTSGEHFVKGPSGGVAYVGNTNLGMGFPPLTIVQQRLAWCLWADVTEPVRLGSCLQTVLREYSFEEWLHTDKHFDRWTSFTAVLLGDPTLAVWPRQPRPVQLEQTDGDGCQWGAFRVTTAAGTPIPHATVTAYLPGQLLLIGQTDAAGEVTLATADCALADATFTVSGRDLIPTVTSLAD